MPNPNCCLPDCDKPKYQNRDYCGSHYMKLYRHGDPYYKYKPKHEDLTGRRFGQLEAIHREASGMWLCRCDCGARKAIAVCSLNAGTTNTCGDRLVHKRQEVVSYCGAHDRVEAHYGRAKDHDCVDCGGPAHEWSYDHTDPDDREELLGRYLVRYSTNASYYQARCRRCHRRLDREMARTRRAMDEAVGHCG